MKAYPLIYSRTKLEDFVTDFLVRPANLNYEEALRYIHNAMENLDTLDAIRYTAFPVDSYCICGGIACISKLLVETLGVMDESVADYLKDCKGRSLACFVGFAIPASEAKANMIPKISLECLWKIQPSGMNRTRLHIQQSKLQRNNLSRNFLLN